MVRISPDIKTQWGFLLSYIELIFFSDGYEFVDKGKDRTLLINSLSSLEPAAVDIKETLKEYVFYADVPGLTKSDI